MQAGSSYQTCTGTIALSTWTLITANYVIKSDYKTTKTAIYVDSTLNEFIYTSGTTIAFLNTDIIRIGGSSTFIGQISQVRIYSPGTAITTSISYI